MRKRRFLATLLTVAMVGTVLAGCGSSSNSGSQSQSSSSASGTTTDNSTSEAGTTTEDNTSGAKEYVDIEVWDTNRGFLEVTKDSELYDFYKELTGVGITQPYVEWNGGETYGEQLYLRIAAQDLPEIFQPVNNMENDLAKQGALLDLTDLLPEKAPHLWNAIPEEVWDVVKANDPTGQGRIWSIPQVVGFARMGGLIRADWLEAVGKEMPTTQEEFVDVLRAFKDQDPNGNGQADEIPAGGRAEARWMDYLFSMYGIAMWEGFPQWDIYDGELTYSAVTPNMKEALQFISELYAEGLLDPETLLNDKAAWDGKVDSNRAGVYYHWAQSTYEHATAIKNSSGVEARISVMPPISADGYNAFYTQMQYSGTQFVVTNTDDQDVIDSVMAVLDAYGNQELWEAFYHGVPGMHCEEVDGKLVNLPEDMKTQQNLILQPYNYIAMIDFTTKLLENSKSDETVWAYDDAIANLSHMKEYGKTIAGDGIPASIYDGYEDIKSRTLYVEYASKIISGEWPIDKFDEFVEKWYATGGQQITEAARAWYEKAQ